MPKGSMPVIVGAGTIGQSFGMALATRRMRPLALKMAAEACEAAFKDAGDAVRAAVDTIAVGRTNEDSVPFGHPHGHNENLPGTIARDLNIAPSNAFYEISGGQSSQKLVNEMAAAHPCRGF